MESNAATMVIRVFRWIGLLVALVGVCFFASWIQAATLALIAPKGLIFEIQRRQSTGWYWRIFWAPERSWLPAKEAFDHRAINEHRRNILEQTGEVLEQLEVPDDGEDTFSLWMQHHVLSRFDKRFQERTLEQRLLMWNRPFDIPSSVEWYGFPFRGWEVRYDDLDFRPLHEMPVLFGIDTGIRRTARPWQWRWRWWLGEQPEYPTGTASKQIPNIVLPVVPRIPQALANGVFTLAAGWGVWWLVKRMRADRRELRGRCGGCGYPRPTGSVGPGGAGRESPQTCPECGCRARVVVRPLVGGRRLGVAWVRRG